MPRQRALLKIRRALAIAALALLPTAAQAGEIRAMVANAVKDAWIELAGAFAKASGHQVRVAWGGTEAIAKRAAAGEAVDVVLVAAPNIDRLVAEGRLAAGSRADFARSGVGVAVREGLPKVDLSSADAVKRAILAARSIGYSSGPSGAHVAELLRRLGIADEVRERVRQPPSGVPIGDLLLRGEVDLGFQQVSELLHVKGIQYVGPLPPELQATTVYAIGLAPGAPEAARALASALRGPDAAAVLRRIGMDPPG